MNRDVRGVRAVAAATVALICASWVGAQAKPQQAGSNLSPNVAAAKAALEKYQDPVVAVADGYLSTLVCMDFPKGGHDGDVEFTPGGMGVHFLNLGNIGPTLDPQKPQVLIYERVGEKLRLAAAEWFVPAQLVQERPRIFDQDLIGPMDGHAPIMPAALRHYDLHVWLWKENPSGMYSSTNPKVACPKSGYSHAEMPAHKH